MNDVDAPKDAKLARKTLLLCDAVEGGFEIAFAFGTAKLVDDLAAFKEEERGQGVDAVLGGQILLFVGIHFADFDFTIIFGGELIQERRDHFAGAAPFRPEVHHDRLGRLQNFFRKILLGQGDD